MRFVTVMSLLLAFGHQAGARSETLQATASANDESWTALGALLGSWSGEGTGDPGQGTGGFSFAWELQGKILVRKNHADYPATKDRPAFSHQDLMVVYQDPETREPEAVYFDSEGHVIKYAVSVSPDAKSIVFLGELRPSTPRYRLTYIMTGRDKVELTFEIAPPGKPDSFKSYIKASARRQ